MAKIGQLLGNTTPKKHSQDVKMKVIFRDGTPITLLVRLPARVEKREPWSAEVLEHFPDLRRDPTAFRIVDGAEVSLYFTAEGFYYDWEGPADMYPYAHPEEVEEHDAKVKAHKESEVPR
jgi:hypothetical protein